MGAAFWTYFLGSMGAFCVCYVVVVTVKNVVQAFRHRPEPTPPAADALADANTGPVPVPDDEHVTFPDDDEPAGRPVLRLVR